MTNIKRTPEQNELVELRVLLPAFKEEEAKARRRRIAIENKICELETSLTKRN